ncbi:MAG: hypothetical protein K0R25_893 [Rickettsiaceae bacterium]|jgi:hypothetical protein|nr:hypothetical protein [Rickettsiaceae bacterium]
MTILKKLILLTALLSISNCKAYQDWWFLRSQDKNKVSAMNQALYLCNTARQWTEISSEDFYKRYYDLREKSGEVWERFGKRSDLFYKGTVTPGFNTSYKNMINDCDRAVGNSYAIYSNDKRMQQESEYAKNLGFPSGIFGYQDKNYNVGISDFINYVYIRSKENTRSTLARTLDKNRWFLIKATEMDRNFQVNGFVKNYVIYRYLSKDYQIIQFVLMRDKKESYLENAPLIGKYFAVVGTENLVIAGRNVEILVLRRVE